MPVPTPSKGCTSADNHRRKFRVEKDSRGVDAVVADFSPAPSKEWLEKFGDSLNGKGFAFSEPLTGTTVTVPFSNLSAAAQNAITQSVTEANGS